jgi:hypothetical protein
MFYIIEKKEQLDKIPILGDCFIDFIPFNNNYHPYLQQDKLSLIYIRGLNEHKGYMLCLNHNESFSLDIKDVFNFLDTHTNKIWVLEKKTAMYFYPNWDKMYDINFVKSPDLSSVLHTNSHSFYYRRHINLPNINCLIPISKHYESKENIFEIVKPIIDSYVETLSYIFNNTKLTTVFHHIEKNGIKIDKNSFIECYDNIKYPEFNISKGRIYSQYKLYTTTGRPSNTYNNINFVALNKTSGERLCYVPSNDLLIETDFSSYHPRLIGELVNYPLPEGNIYEHLGIEKEVMFENLYGGIHKENINKPFFKEIQIYIDNMWGSYQYGFGYDTLVRHFRKNEVNNPTKMFSYVIQGLETYTNVNILLDIIDYLKDKKTKIILYTYDAFLFDYSKEDGNEVLQHLVKLMKYPVNIKTGKNYHNLKKI